MSSSRSVAPTPSIPSVTSIFSPKPSLAAVRSASGSGCTTPAKSTSGDGTTTRANSSSSSIPRDVSVPPSPQPATPSFRSFRNLFPFGPRRTPSVDLSSSSPRTPLSNAIASVRRSVTVERKASGGRSKDSEVDDVVLPAISIITTSGSEIGLGEDSITQTRGGTAENSFKATNQGRSLSYSPLQPAVIDLSTIVESETSGISKHTSDADDSRHSILLPKPSPARSVVFRPPSRRPSADSEGYTCEMELSTSRVSQAVRDALNDEENATARIWREPEREVLVLDGDDEHVLGPFTRSEIDGDRSFNMEELDPDLVAVLSAPGSSQLKLDAPINVVGGFSSPTHPDFPSNSSSPQRAFHSSPNGRSPNLGHQSSRQGRHPPPLTFPAAGWPSPTKMVDRGSPVSSSSTSPDRGQYFDPTRRLQPPPSPLRHETRPTPSKLPPRPALPSTLYTPLRPLPHSATAPASTDASAYDRSRSATPLSSSTSHARERLMRPASALGSSTMQREGPRTRNRSMSVDDQSPRYAEGSAAYRTLAPPARPSSVMGTRPNTAERLGPRTARAFAAAGLLNRDLQYDRTEESERGYAPSRGAASEVGGAGLGRSWSTVRRVSPTTRIRTAEMDHVGYMSSSMTNSPTFSVPGSESTAPTSVSVSTSAPSQLQALRERHEMETGTLLSALSDSQATTKLLRDENTALREKVLMLEDELDHAKALIAVMEEKERAMSSHSRYPASYDTPVAVRLGGEPLLDHVKPTPTLTLPLMERNFSSSSDGDYFAHEAKRADDQPHVKTHRKRPSNASSNFPLLPSNMSLLMQENGDLSGAFSQRSSPPSPTLALPKRSIGRGSTRTHRTAGSMSSGSLSLVMTESDAPGSPGSLQLKPEHEVHLEDMDSLDLAR